MIRRLGLIVLVGAVAFLTCIIRSHKRSGMRPVVRPDEDDGYELGGGA